jgi:hypothetical protein
MLDHLRQQQRTAQQRIIVGPHTSAEVSVQSGGFRLLSSTNSVTESAAAAAEANH